MLYAKNAPDIARDPYYAFLDKYFLALQVPVALLLYAIGGWSFVIYGVFVRATYCYGTTLHLAHQLREPSCGAIATLTTATITPATYGG